MRVRTGSLFAGFAIGLLWAACTVISPPPLIPVHAPAEPQPEGTTTVSLVGGIAGGFWIDDGYGLELRVAHQVSARAALGGGIGLGRARHVRRAREQYVQRCKAKDAARTKEEIINLDCDEVRAPPDNLIGLRIHGIYNPDANRTWYAASAGAGVGFSDTGLHYLTLDAGARLSGGNGELDVYFQPTVALSLPFARGPAIDDGKRPRTTFYYGGSAGLLGNSEGRAGGSADISILRGDSSNDGGSVIFMTAAGQYRVRPD